MAIDTGTAVTSGTAGPSRWRVLRREEHQNLRQDGTDGESSYSIILATFGRIHLSTLSGCLGTQSAIGTSKTLPSKIVLKSLQLCSNQTLMEECF